MDNVKSIDSYRLNDINISFKEIPDFFMRINESINKVVAEPKIAATGNAYKLITFIKRYVPTNLTAISKTKIREVSLKRPLEASIVYSRLLFIYIKLEKANKIINK